MNFPLDFRFKLVALAPQIYVSDAGGHSLAYVKQKMFKLKESIQVYSDESKSELFAQISADRIIDFSATYTFTDPQGRTFGKIRRKGMRSFWRTHYEVVTQGESVDFVIREANPWVKVVDSLLDSIPLVGIASNYLLHPKYELRTPDDRVVMVLEKVPSLVEARFKLHKVADGVDERVALMSFLMMTLLERSRG